MKRIIIWYNANRKSIWKTIGVIVIAYVTLQLVQYIWKQNQIKPNNTNVPNIDQINDIQNKLNSVTLGEDKSTISGEKITNEQVSALEVIDTFVNYCNNNKINEAYSLLSEECKNEMYPRVEDFKNGYYNVIFSDKKNVSVENWTKNIYKVKYMNDALSTGIYEQENTIQDYITVVMDKEKKLNINNYVGKQEIGKETEAYGIKVKLVEKDTYMDYETCTFEVTNNSNNPILLNDNNNMDCMYLEDTNGIKYTAYIHELAEAGLNIPLKTTKRVKIKYYNRYSSNKTIKKVVFSKVILKYNAYANYQNPGYYTDYGIIEINL